MVKKNVKKTEVKPAVKSKKKKKKVPTAHEMMVGAVYNYALSGAINNNQERMATAKSLSVLRNVEMRREPLVEASIYTTYKNCRERVLKIVIDEAIKNNGRFIDVSIVMDMLANDATMLSVWEYENLDVADTLLDSVLSESGKPSTTDSEVSSKDFLALLGGEKSCDCEEDDGDEQG